MEFLDSVFGRSPLTATAKRLDRSRCEISKGVSRAELQGIAEDNDIRTLQFSTPLADSELDNLERIVFSRRPDLTLRVYGHYQLTCDLSILKRIPSVQKLSADCLLNATKVETVTKLHKLQELSIGVFDLESFAFLRDVPATLTRLGLYETFSKKPSIAEMGRLKNLKVLYLNGQQKGIEAISELEKLETAVLSSISTADVNYLTNLQTLWSVQIILGGIKSFHALSSLKSLKYLELFQIRGLNDLSFISEIRSLQHLFIQSQKQVTRLPDFQNNSELRRIYLENLKGLTDLSSLEFAPSLEEFIYVLAGNQQPENLLPVLRNQRVRRVCCRFGSNKKNNHFDELSETYGKEQYTYSEFKYD